MATVGPSPLSPADSAHFKHAARRFASGVTVVSTTLPDGSVYGVTATSFASLSICPLLVTVSLHHLSRMLTYVESSGCFGVSVLREDQRAVSQHFATQGREPLVGGFPGIRSSRAVTGAPLVDGALAYFDCALHEVLPGGDHKILVGNVMAAGGTGGEPLLYYDGDYRALGGADADDALAAEPERAAAGRLGDGVAVQVHLARLTLAELVTAQAAIEPATAELAAEHASERDIERLSALLAAAEDAVADPAMFTRLGSEFHLALAQASGNPLLAASMQALRGEQQALYAPRNDREKSLRSHQFHVRLLDRVKARDGASARSVMAEHVSRVASRIHEPPPG